MGHFNDSENKLSIYEAPKTGGSTLRTWIYYKYVRKKLPLPSQWSKPSKYYFYEPEIIEKIIKIGYKNQPFINSNNNCKICIVRPLLERFISCYKDKIITERYWINLKLKSPLDIDGFLNILEKYGIKNIQNPGITDHREKYLTYHFAPLSYHYGKNSLIYDEIFSTSEISSKYGLKGYLEKIWKIKLPEIHARNQIHTSTFKLNIYQKHRIEDIYSSDIGNGFYF